MKCSSCKSENREELTFCEECGARLELECPHCKAKIPAGKKFCGHCGSSLLTLEAPAPPTSGTIPSDRSKTDQVSEYPLAAEGERKYVTILFSDLSGYTSMTERLDPEEVKEIMGRIFGEIAQIITKYEGFIDKFIGDAVMAIFGVPKSHEDDPIRAIKAAIEIHDLIEAMSPQYEERIGQALSMHSGINTGLVVTGEIDMEKGLFGSTGDAINLASRLQSMARAGEILVGTDTWRQAEGQFKFENLGATPVKGKAEPVQIHKLISTKASPTTVHRLSGLRAGLVGRKGEIALLSEAVAALRAGRGRIFSVCGDAGTGKSRLIEEFKNALDPHEIQWFQSHAYAYAQNIPYFPLINLLSQIFGISEGEFAESVREKLESGVKRAAIESTDIIPYIGSLFSSGYSEIEEVSPEFWRSRLKEGVIAILSALARKAPTVFCLEDLQWADPSFVELLRSACFEIRQPALVLCVYRPTFGLFTSHQSSGLGQNYQEIRLHNLSLSDTRQMLFSLLKTERVPSELLEFVESKAEGNPFYVEELVNSLIESETLTQTDNRWQMSRAITSLDISSSIHGVVSGRLDRLENETKRLLQEASVLGRVFLHEILINITDLKQNIDPFLNDLEHLDLIRTRSLQPEIEYAFKHALTQEVVYRGLLKKDRQKIHERVGLVMEVLFQDRLQEMYDTLAFHFKQSQSVDKAVDYLTKAGEKSIKRYAVEESHQYFREAFDILSQKPDKEQQEYELIIDILLKWAYVFNHRGEFQGLVELFSSHQDIAEALQDNERLGMFYAWLGWGLSCGGKLNDAYEYLTRALQLGEMTDSKRVVGYSCAWLTWTCSSMGSLDEAITFGKKAGELAGLLTSDRDLFRFSLTGIGLAYWFRGESQKAIKAGNMLLEYGRRESDMRCMTTGHWTRGSGYFAAGDFESAIECHDKAILAAPDPVFACGAKLLLGMTYVSNRQLEEADNMFEEVQRFSETHSIEFVGAVGRLFQGIISITRGHLSQGVATVEDLLVDWTENGNKYRYATAENLLGKVYLQIVMGSETRSFSFIARNIGFLVKNVPFADRKAEAHFNRSINVAKEIGAKSLLGQARFDLGLLHHAKHRPDQARQCMHEAIQLFEECQAEGFLEKARETLSNLR